jgi:hypothetical protein
MRMSESATLEKPTLESLAVAIGRLQERLEDLEDLMELRAAVERNQGKPGTPWETVKQELGVPG